MGAFAALRGLPKISIAALWRALFNTGPGPDAGGEKPGPSEFAHSREKSGTDAALCAVGLAAPAAGPASRPKAGVAAIAANHANKRKFPRRIFMRISLPVFLNRLTCSLLSRPRETARMGSRGGVHVWQPPVVCSTCREGLLLLGKSRH